MYVQLESVKRKSIDTLIYPLNKWTFTLLFLVGFDIIVTTLFYHLESNPVVLTLGLWPTNIIKLFAVLTAIHLYKVTIDEHPLFTKIMFGWLIFLYLVIDVSNVLYIIVN